MVAFVKMNLSMYSENVMLLTSDPFHSVVFADSCKKEF